jgi:hypothetical protein
MSGHCPFLVAHVLFWVARTLPVCIQWRSLASPPQTAPSCLKSAQSSLSDCSRACLYCRNLASLQSVDLEAEQADQQQEDRRRQEEEMRQVRRTFLDIGCVRRPSSVRLCLLCPTLGPKNGVHILSRRRKQREGCVCVLGHRAVEGHRGVPKRM